MLQDLGLIISDKKLTPPDTKDLCLGILLDTVAHTMSIPSKELQEIIKKCRK